MGEVKRFSRAEVAQHTGRAGRLWLVYKDSVYDLTDYLAEVRFSVYVALRQLIKELFN